jgi:ATP-dependent phosphoenolpyruvate carboxykinase
MISNIKNKSFFYYNLHNLVKIYVHENISHHLKDDIDFQVGEFLIGKEQFQKDKVSESIFVIPYNFKKIILNEGNFKVLDFHKSKGEISTFFDDAEENLAVYKEDNNFVIFSDTSNFLINIFIQYLLIHKGYSMIHAAGYLNSNGKVNIVTGAGGIGKTAILGYAIKNKKLRYLGDDIIIIGKNQVSFSFPRKFVFKKYHKKIYKDVFKENKIKYFNFYYLKIFIST